MTPAFSAPASAPLSSRRQAFPVCPRTPCPPPSPPVASAANFPFRDMRNHSHLTPLAAPAASLTFRPFPTRSSRDICLLASDLDGTLLNSSKDIDPRNVDAVFAAIAAGVTFVPATGKSRSGALRAMGRLGKHLQNARGGSFPGIFLNGLLVFGGDGRLIFEQKLIKEHATFILEQAEERGLVVLFYAGDDVLVRVRTQETDMFIISHEPVPTAVGDLAAAIESTTLHKALLVDPRGDVVAYRPGLEKAFEGIADITQARPDVLEVLPVGASKGAGFVNLLDDIGVSREHAMAIGDGENDLEMIKTAGLGVAVANSVPAMIRVADEIVCGHDDAAVADAIRQFVLVDS